MNTERLERIRTLNNAKARGHAESAVRHVDELLAHIDEVSRGFTSSPLRVDAWRRATHTAMRDGPASSVWYAPAAIQSTEPRALR
jgi:hypothetical protein